MMKPGKISLVSRMSIFAAGMLTSASLFATQLVPLAPRDPALAGPINDQTGGEKITMAGSEKVIINAPPAAPVPEPTTWGMLILGGGLLTAVRRFRRKQM